jgi:hypothetical protein
VRIDRLASDGIDLRILNRPTSLRFGGFTPDARIEVVIDSISETHETDADGRLQLEAPAAVSMSLRQLATRK